MVKTYEYIDSWTIYDEFVIFINEKSPLNYDLIVDYIEVDKQLVIPITMKEQCYATDFYLIENTFVDKQILTIEYKSENCYNNDLETIKIDLEKEQLVK